MTTIRIAPPASRKLCTLGSVRVLGEDRIGLSTADLVRISSRPIASLGGASGSHPRVKRKGGGYATRLTSVCRASAFWMKFSLSVSVFIRENESFEDFRRVENHHPFCSKDQTNFFLR